MLRKVSDFFEKSKKKSKNPFKDNEIFTSNVRSYSFFYPQKRHFSCQNVIR